MHIVVGTPGRLNDLAQRHVLKLGQCRFVVFDEADKMVADDFSQTADELLALAKGKKQILLLSATFPAEVSSFATRHMHEPKLINTMEELTLQGVKQFYVFLEEKRKVQCLNTLYSTVLYYYCYYYCYNCIIVIVIIILLSSLLLLLLLRLLALFFFGSFFFGADSGS